MGISFFDTPLDVMMRVSHRTATALAERSVMRSGTLGRPLAAADRSRAAAANPVILIHGFSGTVDSWAAIEKSLLRDGFRVAKFAVPDHGFGDIGHATDRLDTFAEGVRRDAHVPAVQLVGHSKGGLIAQEQVRRELAQPRATGTAMRTESVTTLAVPSKGLVPEGIAGSLPVKVGMFWAGPTSSAIEQTYRGSALIKGIQRAQLGEHVRFTSVFSGGAGDGLVKPDTARVIGASNVALEGADHTNHMGLLTSNRAYKALVENLLGGV